MAWTTSPPKPSRAHARPSFSVHRASACTIAVTKCVRLQHFCQRMDSSEHRYIIMAPSMDSLRQGVKHQFASEYTSRESQILPALCRDIAVSSICPRKKKRGLCKARLGLEELLSNVLHKRFLCARSLGHERSQRGPQQSWRYWKAFYQFCVARGTLNQYEQLVMRTSSIMFLEPICQTATLLGFGAGRRTRDRPSRGRERN